MMFVERIVIDKESNQILFIFLNILSIFHSIWQQKFNNCIKLFPRAFCILVPHAVSQHFPDFLTWVIADFDFHYLSQTF